MEKISDDRLEDRARQATSKKAKYGVDIDLNQFKLPEVNIHESIDNPSELSSRQEINLLRKAGFSDSDSRTSGSYLQYDFDAICHKSKDPGVEVLPIDVAWEEYGDWLQDYWWKNVPVDTDKYTAETELHRTRGYFIRAKAGAKITYPLQSCLFISRNFGAQNVHNIVIAEEKSDIHIITGCATSAKAGMHIGVSEFYVKENASLAFTMIHNWAENFDVRPRSVTTVGEGGNFTSNYIAMDPVRSLQLFPTTILEADAIARYNSILYGHPGSTMDVGGRVVLQGDRSRAEVISRAATIGGTIIARGILDGQASEIKAHLECNGLILAKRGIIHAIPELLADRPDLEMSHEASIGRIGEDQLNYLMARGMTEEEATDLIVRGFLSIDIEGLRPEIKAELEKITSIPTGF
ncbi:MAG: SufD family Fe-S cluster assembly protein [Candidatus Heimdallarchaeota archaeon]|nr:MAG: SufD family Fe-S cluster assembly protein [Candidatus Heimdallarchaeota archaeon]